MNKINKRRPPKRFTKPRSVIQTNKLVTAPSYVVFVLGLVLIIIGCGKASFRRGTYSEKYGKSVQAEKHKMVDHYEKPVTELSNSFKQMNSKMKQINSKKQL